MKKKWNVVGMLALALGLTGVAQASTVYLQDFEDPGWVSGTAGDWQDYNGSITRVASGTNGITSSGGSAGHGIVGNTGAYGPYTFFGGSSTDFFGGFTVTQDIFLDPTWDIDTGFDWSVAVYNSGGGHQRDFMWHVGVVDGIGLVVNASNNTDFVFNEYKLLNENGGDYYEVATAGWYTFEQTYYENAGLLYVDFNLYDDSNALVHSITRGGNAADTIPGEVGGNGYGWMTYNTIDDLAIDNTCLEVNAPIPEPTTMSLLAMGVAGLAIRRRNQKA